MANAVWTPKSAAHERGASEKRNKDFRFLRARLAVRRPRRREAARRRVDPGSMWGVPASQLRLASAVGMGDLITD